MTQLRTRPTSCELAGSGLCLHPPGLCPAGASCSTSTSATATKIAPPTTPSVRHQQHQHQPQPQPLTELYGGSMLAIDATEMQTRVILRAAKREVERLVASLAGRCWEDQHGSGGQETGESAEGDSSTGGGFAACPHRGAAGMSMKGSLRRFLEKRRSRLREASASPYGWPAAG